MTETKPNLAALVATILAATLLPPLVAATLLGGGEVEAPRAALCAETPKPVVAPIHPAAPVLACGAAVATRTP
jgi:hypothetical protein